MPSFIFAARRDAWSGEPSTALIEAALRSIPEIVQNPVRMRRGLPDGGNWVGPNARITREASISSRITNVAWLFEWPDPTGNVNLARPDDAARFNEGRPELIRANSEAALNAQAMDGWVGVALPYDPAVNGTREQWLSGAIAQTRTRDHYDLGQQTGRQSTFDNATGESTPQTQLPDADITPGAFYGGGFGGLIGQYAGLLQTIGIVGGAGVLLYLAWPTLAGLRGAGARANPTRRRRRR